ncbi:MAG: CapA family protein [Bacteroidetes bacterium]|nr:CapA family protein [Bacteroidota bacterium]MBU1719427.1 CapA family protein [Bacteroidota bacterium]
MKQTALFLYFLIIFWFFQGFAYSQSDSMPPDRLSLVFAGDLMGHQEQINAAYDKESKTYKYDGVFAHTKDIISAADIAFGNLEVTVGGKPYTGYPSFSSPLDFVNSCTAAGFDVLFTANNHFYDKGARGLRNSIKNLDSMGVTYTGSYLNQDSRDSLYPLVVEKNGIKLGLLNYTYGVNAAPVFSPYIINTINKDQILADIQKVKSKGVDVVIAYMHWGTEYASTQSKAQSDLAEFLFKNGVQVVIGSHPHVIQPMEWRKDSAGLDNIVAYSLGNFVSYQRRRKTDGGALFRLDIRKDADGVVRVDDAGYYLIWVHNYVSNGKNNLYVLPSDRFLSRKEVFADDVSFGKLKLFVDDSRLLLGENNKNVAEFQHISGRWEKKLLGVALREPGMVKGSGTAP